MLNAELAYLSIVKLVKHAPHVDVVSIDDDKGVNVSRLCSISYFTTSEPFAFNTCPICDLNESVKHLHLRLMGLSFKAELVETRFLIGLEALHECFDCTAVCSLSFAMPASVIVLGYDFVWVFD
ncbi:MAG TPA: hypothetical protein DDX04_05570 [Massilia sp.]|nr:hypothetical protein [Massilia sp.]